MIEKPSSTKSTKSTKKTWLKLLRASALQRNACLPYFVYFVLFVDRNGV